MSLGQFELRIPYIRKRMRVWGVMALSLVILATLAFWFSEDHSVSMAFLSNLIFYVLAYFYQMKTAYFSVKEGEMKSGDNPFKKIPISEVVKVKRFLDEITFVTDQKEMMISKDMIEKSDHQKLEQFIQLLETNITSSSDSKKP